MDGGQYWYRVKTLVRTEKDSVLKLILQNENAAVLNQRRLLCWRGCVVQGTGESNFYIRSRKFSARFICLKFSKWYNKFSDNEHHRLPEPPFLRGETCLRALFHKLFRCVSVYMSISVKIMNEVCRTGLSVCVIERPDGFQRHACLPLQEPAPGSDGFNQHRLFYPSCG